MLFACCSQVSLYPPAKSEELEALHAKLNKNLMNGVYESSP